MMTRGVSNNNFAKNNEKTVVKYKDNDILCIRSSNFPFRLSRDKESDNLMTNKSVTIVCDGFSVLILIL